MERRSWLGTLGTLALAVGCGYKAPTDNNNNGGNPPQNPGGTPVASAAVDVGNNYYSPNSVLLSAGGTVTWTWIGNGHSVTSTGSQTFSPNAPVSNVPHTLVVTFPATGDYNYFCTVHGGSSDPYSSGGMVGAIFVR